MAPRHVMILLGLLAACRDVPATENPDAAMGTDAPRPDAPPDAALKKREGQVIVTEARLPDPSSTASAEFIDGLLFTPLGSAGGCEVIADTPATCLDAGVVTITGTTTPLTLVQERLGDVYGVEQVPDDLYLPATTITMAASGGLFVPAFSGTVTTPAPLAQVVLPPSISRVTPPTITWTASTGDEIWLVLVPLDGGPNARTMRCRTNDDGSFALTPAALAQFPADTSQVLPVLYRLNTTLLKAGLLDVSLHAADAVTDGPVSLGG